MTDDARHRRDRRTGIFVLTARGGPKRGAAWFSRCAGGPGIRVCRSATASLRPWCHVQAYPMVATLGELFAWIIGWDLILEYASARSCGHRLVGLHDVVLEDVRIEIPPNSPPARGLSSFKSRALAATLSCPSAGRCLRRLRQQIARRHGPLTLGTPPPSSTCRRSSSSSSSPRFWWWHQGIAQFNNVIVFVNWR